MSLTSEEEDKNNISWLLTLEANAVVLRTRVSTCAVVAALVALLLVSRGQSALQVTDLSLLLLHEEVDQ